MVSVSENVALDKQALMSSYWEYPKRGPSHAVDGDLNQGNKGTNCIRTSRNVKPTWWQVDLGRDFYVHKMDIHFRTDCKLSPQYYAKYMLNCNTSTASIC